MLIVLYGQDTFRLHQRVQVLRRAFVQKFDQTNINTIVWDAKTVTSDTLRSALLARSLFSTRRFVLITDILNLPEVVVPVFTDAIQQMEADSIVVVTTPELPTAKHLLAPVLATAQRTEGFDLLNPTQLLHWTKQQFAEAKVTIAAPALTYLVQACGTDLWAAHNLIEQLIHYKTGLALEDVQLFVLSPLDDNIFHLTDALAERNTALAIRLLHDQLVSGANAFYLLTMLARQIQILLQVKESQGRDTGLHPYVVKKSLQHANRFSVQLLKSIHDQITKIDEQLKTTRLDAGLLLDRLVVTITSS